MITLCHWRPRRGALVRKKLQVVLLFCVLVCCTTPQRPHHDVRIWRLPSKKRGGRALKNQHQSYPPYRQRPPARCIRISRPINPGVSISSRFQEPSSQPATGSAHPRPRPGIAASESRPSILSGSRRAIDPRSADAQARAAQSSIMSIRSVEVHAARRGKRNCRRDPAAHRGRRRSAASTGHLVSAACSSRARQPRTLPLCEALPPRAPATPGAADHARPAGG